VSTEAQKSEETNAAPVEQASVNKFAGLVQGRHVFYQPDGDDTHVCAAIVAEVVDPQSGIVNLLVISRHGNTGGVAEVRFSDGKEPNTWRWMYSSQPTALTGGKEAQHNL